MNGITEHTSIPLPSEVLRWEGLERLLPAGPHDESACQPRLEQPFHFLRVPSPTHAKFHYDPADRNVTTRTHFSNLQLPDKLITTVTNTWFDVNIVFDQILIKFALRIGLDINLIQAHISS
jgi:hypothetical protein